MKVRCYQVRTHAQKYFLKMKTKDPEQYEKFMQEEEEV